MVEKIWCGKESNANIAGLNIPTDDSAEYKLVWNDEFDKDCLDLKKWSANTCGTWNEDHAYTYESPYWRFKDSVATLSMTKFEKENEKGKLYLDAYSFVTSDTMNFQYGYIEMRAKVPFFGKGEFPAFWLLSSQAVLARRQSDYNIRKNRIEIDIFENFGSKRTIVPNLHKYENIPNGWHSQLSGIDHGASVSGTKSYKFPENAEPNDWHTYGMLWTENLISFSVDGEFYYTYDLSQNFGKIEDTDCFHQPVAVIISNQIFSENWCKINDFAKANGPAAPEIFPLDYSVDYVRLYQKASGILLTQERENRTSPFAEDDHRRY